MKPWIHEPKVCVYCGETFIPRNGTQFTCGSAACKRKNNNKLKKEALRRQGRVATELKRKKGDPWFDVLKIMSEKGLQYVEAVEYLKRGNSA